MHVMEIQIMKMHKSAGNENRSFVISFVPMLLSLAILILVFLAGLPLASAGENIVFSGKVGNGDTLDINGRSYFFEKGSYIDYLKINAVDGGEKYSTFVKVGECKTSEPLKICYDKFEVGGGKDGNTYFFLRIFAVDCFRKYDDSSKCFKVEEYNKIVSSVVDIFKDYDMSEIGLQDYKDINVSIVNLTSEKIIIDVVVDSKGKKSEMKGYEVFFDGSGYVFVNETGFREEIEKRKELFVSSGGGIKQADEGKSVGEKSVPAVVGGEQNKTDENNKSVPDSDVKPTSSKEEKKGVASSKFVFNFVKWGLWVVVGLVVVLGIILFLLGQMAKNLPKE